MAGAIQAVLMGVSTGGASGFENLYDVPGTYSWTCPPGVTSVCVVCIGGGGGGVAYTTGDFAMHGGAGGGLGWKNDIAVTPGNSYTVDVGVGGPQANYSSVGFAGGNSYFISLATVAGYGGPGGAYNTNKGAGGTFAGDGGGAGGGTQMTAASGYGAPGGGGAGGYSGAGGKGTDDGQAASLRNGSGGGAAGGYTNGSITGYGGGGVGVFGEGASGVGGTGGGAGGSDGGSATTSVVAGLYGGGGGGSNAANGTAGNGAGGAVRIIWGNGRAFPSTGTEISPTYVPETGPITSIAAWESYSSGRQTGESLATATANATMTSYTGYNLTWMQVTNPVLGGTMWGSPYNNPAYVTNDSTLSRVVQHGVLSTAAANGIVNNSLTTLLQMTYVGSQVTTGITRNGYTSVSYTAFASMRIDAIEYFDTDLGKAVRTTFPGQTTEDILV